MASLTHVAINANVRAQNDSCLSDTYYPGSEEDEQVGAGEAEEDEKKYQLVTRIRKLIRISSTTTSTSHSFPKCPAEIFQRSTGKPKNKQNSRPFLFLSLFPSDFYCGFKQRIRRNYYVHLRGNNTLTPFAREVFFSSTTDHSSFFFH